MVRTSARSRFAVACTAAALSSTACFDTSSSVATGTYPTLLTVDPALFRGTVPCGTSGFVQYVATLTDITTAETLPSSLPTSCENYVSFGEPLPDQPGARGITVDHLYVGLIEAYDRKVEAPMGAEGSRSMIDVETQAPIAPRWSTTCGQIPWTVSDAGSDVETDSGDPTSGEEDAGPDVPPQFNALRLPTQAIWKKEVILRGCYPLSSMLGPDASVGDANTGADAPVTPDDGGDGVTPDPDDGGSSG